MHLLFYDNKQHGIQLKAEINYSTVTTNAELHLGYFG
jgi:hypothetical protein